MARTRSLRITVLPVAVLLLAGLVWIGCGGGDQLAGPAAPDDPALTGQAQYGFASQAVLDALDVKERHVTDIMSREGIAAMAVSFDETGEPVIKIYTEHEVAPGHLPDELEGLRVVREVSGRIVAMKGPPGGGNGGTGDDPQAKQTPPIKMGTSGGWGYDLANGYCCGGTLGALIQVGGTKRILSNYHVLEADIVNGGNGRRSETGDPVIQPGLIDVACNAANAQNVATLVVTSSLPGSNVDASTATVISGMVDETGAILSIGVPSSSTVAAFVGQKVKKMGRTTGLSRSTVDGLGATVNVAYENECAGGAAFTKQFTGQIVIKNRGSKFLAGGDSGSVMFEDENNNPRAVGLLFAGSSTAAIANPIGEVLSFFGASMVGN